MIRACGGPRKVSLAEDGAKIKKILRRYEGSLAIDLTRFGCSQGLLRYRQWVPPLSAEPRASSEAEMAKKVTIQSGVVFSTLKAAKDHFSKLREATPLGTRLSEPERSDALDVYRRYCHATKWQAEDAVDVTTEWDNRQRPMGTHAQTKAFAVVTASGSTKVFSVDKALEAIAI
jgi:hypothetical protein